MPAPRPPGARGHVFLLTPQCASCAFRPTATPTKRPHPSPVRPLPSRERWVASAFARPSRRCRSTLRRGSIRWDIRRATRPRPTSKSESSALYYTSFELCFAKRKHFIGGRVEKLTVFLRIMASWNDIMEWHHGIIKPTLRIPTLPQVLQPAPRSDGPRLPRGQRGGATRHGLPQRPHRDGRGPIGLGRPHACDRDAGGSRDPVQGLQPGAHFACPAPLCVRTYVYVY